MVEQRVSKQDLEIQPFNVRGIQNLDAVSPSPVGGIKTPACRITTHQNSSFRGDGVLELLEIQKPIICPGDLSACVRRRV